MTVGTLMAQSQDFAATYPLESSGRRPAYTGVFALTRDLIVTLSLTLRPAARRGDGGGRRCRRNAARRRRRLAEDTVYLPPRARRRRSRSVRAAMKTSGGLVLLGERHGALEVLLGHMGGPWWRRQDECAWSIPKGELEPDEDPLAGARREFAEELGDAGPDGDAARARRDPPAVRQARDRVSRSRRLRPGDDHARDVPDDVAAALRPHAGLPGGRSRRVVDLPAAETKLVRGQVEPLARLAAARAGG